MYQIWSAPPFGVKAGVAPVLALAFFLANQGALALYHDGMFVPEIGTLQIDEWLQEPKRIVWRFVESDSGKKGILSVISDFLSSRLKRAIASEPLEVSRALVSLVLALPGWTKRTITISEQARAIRQILSKRQRPPSSVVHRYSIGLEGEVARNRLQRRAGGMPDRTASAFPKALSRVETVPFEALCHDGNIENLNKRGASWRALQVISD